jgi:fatty acid desaturase
VTLSEVHSIVPKHLHEKNTFKSLLYVLRDVFSAFVVYELGWTIDPFANLLVANYCLSPNMGAIAKWALWALYWHTQGIILAGWWCVGHEAGHGSLSNHRWVNHLIGYTMHSVCPSAFFCLRYH